MLVKERENHVVVWWVLVDCTSTGTGRKTRDCGTGPSGKVPLLEEWGKSEDVGYVYEKGGDESEPVGGVVRSIIIIP